MCKFKEECICATCVYNPLYTTNTPVPCLNRDCDMCEDGDMSCEWCTQYLSLDELNKKLQTKIEEVS